MTPLEFAHHIALLAKTDPVYRARWNRIVVKVREMDHPPAGPKTGSIGDITPKLDRSGNRDEN